MNNTMHNTESMMAAIDGITLPIILLDRMGAICNFNLGAATLLGITAKHAEVNFLSVYVVFTQSKTCVRHVPQLSGFGAF